MNNKNPNLEEYFSAARKEPPLVSNDEARNIIESGNSVPADFNKSLIKTNKGFKKMNLLLSGLATTAAIGIISFNLFNSGNIAEQINTTKATLPELKSENGSAGLTADNQKIENKTEPLPARDFDTRKKNEDKVRLDDSQKIDVQGVKLVELNNTEAEKLGITAIAGENPSIQFWDSRVKPMLCTLFVKGGFSFVSNDETNSKLPPKLSPRMITDNTGNRRYSVISSEGTKLIKTDHATINTNDFSDKKEKKSQKTMVLSHNLNLGDSSLKLQNFSAQLKLNSHQLMDSARKLVKNINIDSLVKVSMKLYKNSHINKFNSNGDSIKEGVYEMFVNEIPDSVLNQPQDYTYNFNYNTDDNNSKNKQEEDIELELFTKNQDEKMNNLNQRIDSIQKKITIQVNVDSVTNAIQMKFNKSMSSIRKIQDSVLEIESPMMFFEEDNREEINPSDSTRKIHKKAFDVSYDFSKKIAELNAEMDKYIRINKMIPVVINMGKNPEKNEMNSNDDFAFILWYDPTPELLEILPESVKARIEPELRALSESSQVCNTAIKGDEAYFDIWRACSGAVENLHTFPNPAKDQIYIKYNLTSQRTVTISINDLFGRRITDLMINVGHKPGLYEEHFTLDGINPGMYLISLKTDKNERAVQRVVIE